MMYSEIKVADKAVLDHFSNDEMLAIRYALRDRAESFDRHVGEHFDAYREFLKALQEKLATIHGEDI